MSQAAVALAAERLGGLAGRRVLVLGAGEMGEGMAVALAGAGAAEVLVANRTAGPRPRRSPTASAAGPCRLDDAARRSSPTSTCCSPPPAPQSLILEHADLAPVMAARAGRPLLIVDIAVPRDVDPAAGDLAGVTLLDMDDLRAFAERRRRRAGAARSPAREPSSTTSSTATRRAPPPARSPRSSPPCASGPRPCARPSSTASAARLADLDDRQREAVEAATRAIVAKLLHEPTVRLKDAAGTAQGDRLAESLRDLFDL